MSVGAAAHDRAKYRLTIKRNERSPSREIAAHNQRNVQQAERDTRAREAREAEARKAPLDTPSTAVVRSASNGRETPAIPTSTAALERHLEEWAGPAGRLLAPNLQEGFHRTLDDGNEMKLPRRLVAHMAQLRRGFIMFNVDGPPTVWDRGISEDAPEIRRDELPFQDRTLWPISNFTGEPDDPVKSQITFPLVSCDRRGRNLHLCCSRFRCRERRAGVARRVALPPETTAGLDTGHRTIERHLLLKTLQGRPAQAGPQDC